MDLPPTYILAFAKGDERARIAELLIQAAHANFPPRELIKLRRELQERSKALAKTKEIQAKGAKRLDEVEGVMPIHVLERMSRPAAR